MTQVNTSYSWALSAKQRNRLAHALNGNTQNSTVDISKMTRTSLENQFSVLQEHIKEMSQERDAYLKKSKAENKKLQNQLEKQKAKAKKTSGANQEKGRRDETDSRGFASSN